MNNDWLDYLAHHGIEGQKWGIRNGPPYPLNQSVHGHYKPSDRVFVSGKVKFDEPIPKTVKNELNRIITVGAKILIGDAPGADTRVQDYLAEKKYRNVIVYTTDEQVRNNVGNWDIVRISGNGNTEERIIRRQKDIAMTKASTRGIAISSYDDRPDSATALNIERLMKSGKDVEFYDYKKKVIRPVRGERYEQ